jgi:hypothetical protein
LGISLFIRVTWYYDDRKSPMLQGGRMCRLNEGDKKCRVNFGEKLAESSHFEDKDGDRRI